MKLAGNGSIYMGAGAVWDGVEREKGGSNVRVMSLDTASFVIFSFFSSTFLLF